MTDQSEYIRLRTAYIATSAHMGDVNWRWNRSLTTWDDVSTATKAAADAYAALNQWEADHTKDELADAEVAYWRAQYPLPEGVPA